MGRTIEGETRRAKIIDIKPAWELGSDGDYPIAIIRGPQTINGDTRIRDSWLPVPRCQNLQPDSDVEVTPVTKEVGKGSETTFRIKPL